MTAERPPPNHAIAERSGIHLPGFRLVLVRPKFAGNLGACARLAANFGVRDLHTVAPEIPGDWKTSEQVQAFATGSSTEQLRDFVEHARLSDALKPCTRAIAFTRRPREQEALDLIFSRAILPPGQTPASPREVAWPAHGEKIALVFGNEKTGLTLEELKHCTHCVRIATSDELGSMNLSHAVAVVLARLFEHAEAATLPQASSNITAATDDAESPARLEELEPFWLHWREALVAVGLDQGGNPERMLRSFRALLAPLNWKRRDVQLFRGFFTRIIRHAKVGKTTHDEITR